MIGVCSMSMHDFNVCAHPQSETPAKPMPVQLSRPSTLFAQDPCDLSVSMMYIPNVRLKLRRMSSSIRRHAEYSFGLPTNAALNNGQCCICHHAILGFRQQRRRQLQRSTLCGSGCNGRLRTSIQHAPRCTLRPPPPYTHRHTDTRTPHIPDASFPCAPQSWLPASMRKYFANMKLFAN